MNEECQKSENFKPDDLSSPSNKMSWILWRVPLLVMFLSFFILSSLKIYIWPMALGLMGSSCVFNARKCKRRECFVNGPYYLILALLSYLHGSNIISFGNYGWYFLGIATLCSQLNIIIIERFWGRYLPWSWNR